jgi:hypothetical protein
MKGPNLVREMTKVEEWAIRSPATTKPQNSETKNSKIQHVLSLA